MDMKRIIAIIVVLVTTVGMTEAAKAGGGWDRNDRGHEGGHHHGMGNDWIGPLIIGGAIGWTINEISQPRTVYVPQYVQQPPVVYVQPYTPPPMFATAPPVVYVTPPVVYVPPPIVYGQGDMDWYRFQLLPPAECARFANHEDQLYACYRGWKASHPNMLENAYNAGLTGR